MFRLSPPPGAAGSGSVFRLIAACPLPLVMYGTGDGAERITKIIGLFGRGIDMYIASDDFYRPGRKFMGRPVMRYSDACALPGDFAVVLGFGSARPEVTRNVRRIASERKLFVPDLPVVSEGDDPLADVFTGDDLESIRDDAERLGELLTGGGSKKLLSSLLSFRLTGDISLLDGTASDDLYLPLYHSGVRYDTAADLGADRGESSVEMLTRFPMLERVIAVEADGGSFRRLEKLAGEDRRVEPHHRAVSSSSGGAVTMMQDGSRGGSASRRASRVRGVSPKQVETASLDDLLGGRGCRLIHIDVEGMEREAIKGAEQTIRRCSPDMMVSVYHRKRDIVDLPLMIHEMMPGKRLHLVRPDAYPPWDVMCVAEG